MRITSTPHPDQSWDLVPLLLAGVTTGLLCLVLTAVGSAWAVLVGFVGLVLLLTVVVRHTRGASEEASAGSRERVPGHV
jgi:hypothetical protein